LAWKQDNLSVAELFFAKLSDVDAGQAGEHATGLLCEIGIGFLAQEQYDEAKKWLKRAYTILQQCDWRYTFDDQELRLNVMHAYTRSLFALEEHHEEARGMLATLQAEYPERLPVSVLRMEHYTDARELRTILESTMHSMQLIRSNFQLILHHVHVLRKLNAKYACKALGNFIVKRLIPEKMSDWIETSTLTLIWMITADNGSYNTPESLTDALSILRQADNTLVLSSELLQGAIVLIWKQIEQACETDAQLAIRWCEVALALAREINAASTLYEGKLSRKLILCCIAAEDYASAQNALEKLPLNAKDHHLTRYLAYVVAMRNNDETMAEQALRSLASAPKDADKLLFACVSETDRYGTPKLQAKLLQRILDKNSDKPTSDVNISALLRATARLLWQVLEEATDDVDEELLERLCAVFKAAKTYSVRCNSDQAATCQSFGAFECEWFSKNGYNLALKMMQQWPNAYILRILETITHLRYPENLPDGLHEQHSQRNKKTAYVRIILYITEARHGDVTAYTKAMTVYNNSVRIIEYDQLFAPLMPLLFEAALHSNLPDRQNTLTHLLASLTLDSPKAYAACADMVLTAGMASDETQISMEVAVGLLNRIIAQVRALDGYDIKRASRWIRCVIQLIIDTSAKSAGADPSNAAAGLSILRDALDEAAHVVQDAGYPSEELEWLATTTFNLAVDLYVQEEDEQGKKMAGRALGFADGIINGGLAKMLRGRMRRIGWC
jgi:tetratricopeptide (TPR) repeat protein